MHAETIWLCRKEMRGVQIVKAKSSFQQSSFSSCSCSVSRLLVCQQVMQLEIKAMLLRFSGKPVNEAELREFQFSKILLNLGLQCSNRNYTYSAPF